VNDSVTFMLPLRSSTNQVTIFSDGQRTLQFRGGRISFAVGPAAPIPCQRG